MANAPDAAGGVVAVKVGTMQFGMGGAGLDQAAGDGTGLGMGVFGDGA